MDESGFTGTDLLNPDQPQFCVASSIIDEADAERILRVAFPRYAGEEFKFGALWKRERNRAGLIEFGKTIRDIADNVFVFRIDKKFCALTKLVDWLIEPPAHAAGFDFYADGYAPKYCNMWYFGIHEFVGEELYTATVEQYQRFARNPTDETLSALAEWLTIVANTAPEQIGTFYEAAAFGAQTFKEFHCLEEHQFSNEIQFTTVLESVSHWRRLLADDLAVFHDASTNFFSNAEMWDTITRADVPEQVVRTANGSMNEFPLRVVQTTSMNSKESFSVQLCDVIAGLSAKICRESPEERDFLLEVVEAGFGEVRIGGIRPEPELPDGPPRQLDGPDAVDLLTRIMYRR